MKIIFVLGTIGMISWLIYLLVVKHYLLLMPIGIGFGSCYGLAIRKLIEE